MVLKQMEQLFIYNKINLDTNFTSYTKMNSNGPQTQM